MTEPPNPHTREAWAVINGWKPSDLTAVEQTQPTVVAYLTVTEWTLIVALRARPHEVPAQTAHRVAVWLRVYHERHRIGPSKASLLRPERLDLDT